MIVTRELIERAEAGLEFDPRSVRRALADRTPTSDADPAAVQRRLVHVLGEGPDASELAIDRIVAGSDALNVSYLERGMIAADAVARVAVHDGARLVGYGTGFMVSPRLLLTNYHVLTTADTAVHSVVDFRYEYDALGHLVERATFGLDPAAFFFGDPELDVTLVAVAPETADGSRRASDFGWLRLSASADTVLRGEWLSIIQHCGGRPKQVSLRQNLLITRSGPDLWYVSETATGSSGAPIFNDSWQVVGLHRLGAPARGPSGEILTADGERWSEWMDESRIVWRQRRHAHIGGRRPPRRDARLASAGAGATARGRSRCCGSDRDPARRRGDARAPAADSCGGRRQHASRAVAGAVRHRAECATAVRRRSRSVSRAGGERKRLRQSSASRAAGGVDHGHCAAAYHGAGR